MVKLLSVHVVGASWLRLGTTVPILKGLMLNIKSANSPFNKNKYCDSSNLTQLCASLEGEILALSPYALLYRKIPKCPKTFGHDCR